jgi:2-polyprenyl-6-methoxyphenol hydroxylase-like FAD-dependent oxidoreductase
VNKKHQVVIVGGGPVGVALAVELGLRGVSCALVERYREPQRIPKGQNLTAPLEHFASGVSSTIAGGAVIPHYWPLHLPTATW